MMDICTLVGLNFLMVKSLIIRVFAAWLVMHLIPVVQLIYHKKNSKKIIATLFVGKYIIFKV